MEIHTSKSDIIWSYLGYFFTYATNLLIVLFVMRRLKTELLGLWYTFLSVGALVQILDFGISSTLIRNFTYVWSGVSKIEKEGFSDIKNRDGEVNFRLLGEILFASKNICLVIAVIATLLMAAVGTPYIIYVARDIATSEYLVSWILYVIATFFNIYFIFWPDSLTGVGAIKEAQIASVISRMIQIIVAVIFANLGMGLVGLSAANLIMGIVLRVISKYFLYGYHCIGEKIRELSIKNSFSQTQYIFSIIWYNAKKAGIVSLTTFLLKQTSTLVCSAYIGLSETASYGLCLQIIGALAAIASIWFKAETPMIVSLKVANNVEEVKNHFSLSIFIYWLVFICGTLVVSTVGIYFLSLINYNTSLPLNMLLFVALVTCLEYNHSLFCGYIAMSNNLPYVNASTIAGIVVALLTIICGKYIGSIYSLIAVQFFVQLVYNNWKWPSVVLKELEMSAVGFMSLGYRQFIKRIVLRVIRIKNTI